MEIKEQIKQTKERKKGFVKALPSNHRKLLKLYEQAKAGEKRSLIGIFVWAALLVIAYVLISLALPYANNWIWNGVIALVLLAAGITLLLFLRKSYKEKAESFSSFITENVNEYEGIKDRIRQLEKAEKERADAARKAERAEERARIAREKAEREAALAQEQADRARKETEAALGVQATATETSTEPALEPEPVACEPVAAAPMPAEPIAEPEPIEVTEPIADTVATFAPAEEINEETAGWIDDVKAETTDTVCECSEVVAEEAEQATESIEEAVEAFTDTAPIPEGPEQILEDAKVAFAEAAEEPVA